MSSGVVRLRVFALTALMLLSLVALSGCKWRRAGGPSVAEIIGFDITQHAFVATRRFTSHAGGQTISYTEQASSRGDGVSYWVDLLELDGLPRAAMTDPADQDRFDRLARMLTQGGAHRVFLQRDYRVTDVSAFLSNYRVIPLDASRYPYHLGSERFMVFLVLPDVLDRPTYEVVVSVEPDRLGFPLRYSEFAYDDVVGSYTLASEMEVLALDFGHCPDRGVTPGPIQSRRSFADLRQANAATSLTLLVPSALPAGFQLSEVEEVTLLTDAESPGTQKPVTLYRFVFSDGLDRLEIVQHSKAMRAPPAPALRGGPWSRTANTVVPVFRFGSLYSASVTSSDHQIVVEGRISYQRFTRVMRSLIQVQ